ncbi:hypothetical protein BD779DRAFT_1669368 [Infundibulicybe gibba]|nr:hypothetical protein BD779DRAFT_1669368 [Infundibulicybe gibba]
MERDQPSRAEQRMQAVARLKRAASLPRMKDGRRPPMHVEAVSEGEKGKADDDSKDLDTPPPEAKTEDPEPPDVEVELDAEVEVEADAEDTNILPERATRPKRRSRSRSRSRGSKDFKGKVRATQSPTPVLTGDSSQDEDPPLPLPIALPVLLSPIPSYLSGAQRPHLLRSPTPTSPEPYLFYPGTSPPTPMPLPSLEALQKGLYRSNSAGRSLALHKLTGGMDTYELSPSPTPPLPSTLSRNNTVSGGERDAARQNMFSRLGGRFTKVTGRDEASGGEDIIAPSPTPKRKKRRSRRGSTSANTGVSDSDFISTSPNTPIVPPTPLPPSVDTFLDLRIRSATPSQSDSPGNHHVEPSPDSPLMVEIKQMAEPERLEPTRRRSVVVEEEEDEAASPQPRYPGLPRTPPQRFPPHVAALRAPHGSDAPSSNSTDSASASAIGVPVYLSQRAPSRNDLFPSSPFGTPLKEKPSRDEDEEQVLYPADSYRRRTPYEESAEREISWVASPVPEIRMPIDDGDEDEEDEDDHEDREDQDDEDEPPLSARSSNGFSPPEALDDISPRVSSDSKSLMVESETSPDNTPSYVPPSPSSTAALSQSASITRASDDSISGQVYPARLSIASRIQGDRSPLNTEFTEWEERIVNIESPSKRNGDTASTSTWEKVKSTFSRAGSSAGRRSRTNSIVTRDRRDHTDSSISRESGASITSGRTDKVDPISTFTQQQSQQPLMQSPSASASILSLAPYPASRGGPSPIPPASSADLSKYQNAKLFPFPGMKKLEEQRNRAKGLPSASASSPDVTMLPGGNEEDQPPHSASSFNNTPAHTPEMARDRKLSTQNSDTRLYMKYINASSPTLPASPSSPTQPDYFNISPQSPTSNSGLSNLKLPMTLPGVKQWLNNKKIFSSSPSSPPLAEVRASPNSKLSDLFRGKENDLGTDWEDIGSTPTSASGDTLLGKQVSSPEIKDSPRKPKRYYQLPTIMMETSQTFTLIPHLYTRPLIHYHQHRTFLVIKRLPQSLHVSIILDKLITIVAGNIGAQGTFVLERLDENLARGSRSPMWASAVDDPARKLMLSSPVLQVVNPNTVKDRFLFLFNDILIIAKPVIQEQDSLMDAYSKPNPLDRKFVVKSVVLLHQLRINPDRTDTQPKTSSYATAPRNPVIKSFVHQFTKDPDHAISSLFSKTGMPDDPTILGQLLFKTLDLDRTRLGEYLSRRTSKFALKAYLDNFGFLGLRVDRALRVFLYSVHLPSRSSYTSNPLDHLLDAFASRWYEANAGVVAYDKDLAVRLVRALVQLNELLHDGIAEVPGHTGYPKRDVTSRDFLEAFRRYDVRNLVSDELLDDVYTSIRQERLSQAREPSSAVPDIPIQIKRSLPARLTYKIQSEPIILRIPQADPHLTIHLYGQDLIFDPPILNFVKSPEASFRVMGTSLGPKTMIMCRYGPNALSYSGLPLSTGLIVERAFMRNTFQIAFLNHDGMKRRYMFSVDDPLIRHQWVVSLTRQIDQATASMSNSLGSSPGASKFSRAAQGVAFKILQETLIGKQSSSVAPAAVIQKALHRLNGSSHHRNGSSSFSFSEPRPVNNGFQFPLIPVQNRGVKSTIVTGQDGMNWISATPLKI